MLRIAISWLIASAVLSMSHVSGVAMPDQDLASIHQLIDGFQQAIVDKAPVEQFFSPSARAAKREDIDALQSQGFLSFGITDYNLNDAQLQDAEHVSLPVTVKWSTRDREASKTMKLRFVKEQGKWYFENVDFWRISFLWFFLPLITIAVAYGCGVVIMYWHVGRQQWVDASKKTLWQTLSIVPLLPFLYFARKPWSH